MTPSEELVGAMTVADLATMLGVTVREVVERAQTPSPRAEGLGTKSEATLSRLQPGVDVKLAEITKNARAGSPRYMRTVSMLNYLVNKGKVQRVARGVYRRTA